MFFLTQTQAKSLLVLLFAVGTLGGGTPAIAQSTITVRGNAGAVVPSVTKQFEGFYSSGSHFSVGVGYFLNPSFEIHVRASHARFALDKQGVDEYVPEIESNVSGGSGTMWAGSVNMRFHSPTGGPLDLRLNGGVGLYQHSLYGVTLSNPDLTDTFRFGSQEQLSPGLNFGIGVAWSFSPRLRITLDPEYILVFGDQIEEDLAREQTGLFGFVTIRGGVEVRL